MNETKRAETHQGPAFTRHVHCILNGRKKNGQPPRPSIHTSRTNTVPPPTKLGQSVNTAPPPTKLGQSVITTGTKAPDSHQGPALVCRVHTLRHLQESWDKVYTFAGTGIGASGVTCPCGTQRSGAAMSSKPWAYFHLPPMHVIMDC